MFEWVLFVISVALAGMLSPMAGSPTLRKKPKLRGCLLLILLIGFDPNAGRRLHSFGRAAGFPFLNTETDRFYKVFGKIDLPDYDL